VISLEGVSKSFDGGATYAVRDVSLEVAEGETLVLLGSSGCGKTTTLKMINRLIEPTAGTVRVGRKDAREQDVLSLRRSMGYVFQGIGLFPHLCVDRHGDLDRYRHRHSAGRRDRAAGMGGRSGPGGRRDPPGRPRPEGRPPLPAVGGRDKSRPSRVGRAGGRLGVDTLDFYGFRALEGEGLALADADEAIQAAREIKTSDEIELLKQSAAVCEAALFDLEKSIRPGVTENELLGIFWHRMLALGGEITVPPAIRSSAGRISTSASRATAGPARSTNGCCGSVARSGALWGCRPSR